jgi:hypothetical protein
MPLDTDDIDEARVAYAALEARLAGLQQAAAAAQAGAAALLQANRGLIDTIGPLRQRVLDLEGRNAELDAQVDAIAQLRADLTVADLVQSVGLALALGTATLADRTVPSATVNVQSYVAPAGGPVGLRLQQPELAGLPVGLSSTQFTLAQVPVGPQAPAPRPLFAVLLDKQRLYGGPPFEGVQAAAQLVAAAAQTLATAGSWTVPYLAGQASTIAGLEGQVAQALLAAGQARAGGLRDAARALGDAATAVATRARPVAADVWTLATLLDASTRAGQALAP